MTKNNDLLILGLVLGGGFLYITKNQLQQTVGGVGAATTGLGSGISTAATGLGSGIGAAGTGAGTIFSEIAETFKGGTDIIQAGMDQTKKLISGSSGSSNSKSYISKNVYAPTIKADEVGKVLTPTSTKAFQTIGGSINERILQNAASKSKKVTRQTKFLA